MKSRLGFNIHKARYGTYHEDDPRAARKPKPLDKAEAAVRQMQKVCETLGADIECVAAAFNDLARGLVRMQREVTHAQQIRALEQSVIDDWLAVAQHEAASGLRGLRDLVGRGQNIRRGVAQRVELPPSDWVTIAPAPDVQFVGIDHGAAIVQNVDYAEIENRIRAAIEQREAARPRDMRYSTIQGERSEFYWPTVEDGGTRTGRWSNPDANIRSVRRDRR